MGWPEAMMQELMYDTKDMNGDLKELVILLVQLEGLTSPINATNWDDALETWLSLCQLPRKMRGERSRMVLTQIFDSEPLKDAIGMANQRTEIQRGENSKYVPDGLVSRFKRDAGAHIKVRIVLSRCILYLPATTLRMLIPSGTAVSRGESGEKCYTSK
jgi:hypothetical protein